MLNHRWGRIETERTDGRGWGPRRESLLAGAAEVAKARGDSWTEEKIGRVI